MIPNGYYQLDSEMNLQIRLFRVDYEAADQYQLKTQLVGGEEQQNGA